MSTPSNTQCSYQGLTQWSIRFRHVTRTCDSSWLNIIQIISWCQDAAPRLHSMQWYNNKNFDLLLFGMHNTMSVKLHANSNQTRFTSWASSILLLLEAFFQLRHLDVHFPVSKTRVLKVIHIFTDSRSQEPAGRNRYSIFKIGDISNL